MKKQIIRINIAMLSLFLLSCDGGPKGQADTTDDNHLLSEFESGQIYYNTNCADCHSAGVDDPNSAFGASDLRLVEKFKITNNMTKDNPDANNYGGKYNLMKRFSRVPTERVHQLRTYLDNIN